MEKGYAQRWRNWEKLLRLWVQSELFQGTRLKGQELGRRLCGTQPCSGTHPPRNGNFWYINRFSLAMDIGILVSWRLLGASDFITGSQRRKVGRHWTVAPQRQSDLGNHTSPALLDSQLSMWVCPQCCFPLKDVTVAAWPWDTGTGSAGQIEEDPSRQKCFVKQGATLTKAAAGVKKLGFFSARE